MSAGVRKIAVPRTAPIVMSAPSHAPRARTREGAGAGVASRFSGIKRHRVLSSPVILSPSPSPVILSAAKDLPSHFETHHPLRIGSAKDLLSLFHRADPSSLRSSG